MTKYFDMKPAEIDGYTYVRILHNPPPTDDVLYQLVLLWMLRRPPTICTSCGRSECRRWRPKVIYDDGDSIIVHDPNAYYPEQVNE